MKKVVSGIAASAALLLGLTACAGTSLGEEVSAPKDGPVKVGFMIPKTGVYASLGTDLERGLTIFLEQHDNKLGGRAVELVTIDEGGTPQTGTAAAQRLIQNEGVEVVTGILNTATAIAVAPMFAEAKIPVLSTSQVENNPYWWRSGYTNPAINESMVDYLLANHKDEPLYLIGADYKQGHDVIDAVKAGFEAGGGTVVDSAFTPFGTTQDFQPYLAKIRSSGATMTYAFYAGAEAIQFVTQYNQFGLSADLPLYSTQGLTEGVLAAEGPAAEGVFTNGTYSAALETKLNQEFVKAYTAKYDSTPSVFSEAQYAAAVVLDEALKNIGDGTMQDAILSLDEVTSPRGSWHFDKDNSPTQMLYLRRATEKDGTMINKVVEELGIYSGAGVRQ